MSMVDEGSTITEIREMNDQELEREGWARLNLRVRPPVLVFDDGSKVYPSADPEGNGPGALFGIDEEDNAMQIIVHSRDPER